MMNEEKQVKKQLFKNMVLNLITFSIIFYILGAVIYTQFNNTLYNSADKELTSTQNRESDIPKQRGEEINNKDGFEPTQTEDFESLNKPTETKNQLEGSPRVAIIERNESGEIIENNETNNMLNSILKYAPFDKNTLGTVYETTIQKYSYRGINYKNTDGTYKQVLINVDSEKEISTQFAKNLIISFILSLIAILIASYILSRKTLKPIVESWKKQTKFVQDASHELRTPLSIIKVKQETLLEKPESKIIDNAEDINITLQETQRLTKLINELMELAKNDSNEFKLNKEQFYFDEEIKSLLQLYKEVAATEEKTLNIDLKYNERIYADLNKLKELLVILLDNAIKYTKKGDSIDVRTYKKDNKLVLEIEDTGIGISKEAIGHVFERFYREEKSRNRQKGGMGLGLSIAYNIVSAQKGTIRFEKNRKIGAKVIVTLPKKRIIRPIRSIGTGLFDRSFGTGLNNCF